MMNNFGFVDDYKVHTISSVFSGLIAAIMGTPADVIKTRIMYQPVDSKGRYPFKESFAWALL
jgi:solute carrier family 25 uncoupling protein 27